MNFSRLEILIATDGSRTACRALQAVLPLCRRGRPRVLSVVPYRGMQGAALAASLEAREAALAREVAALRSDVSMSLTVLPGLPSEAILSEARSLANQLVVMGPGEHGLLGTTAERVIRKSAVPVLIAGQSGCADLASPSVLVALDGSAPSMRSLQVAKSLVQACGGRLRIVTVVPTAEHPARRRMLQLQQDTLADAGLDWSGQVLPGDPLAILQQQLDADRPDLLVVGATGRSGRPPGTLTRRLLSISPVPVLICP